MRARNLVAGAVAATLFTGPAAWAGTGERGNGLQRDADAIRDLGVVGVQVREFPRTGPGKAITSGVADIRTGRPVPPDGYSRIGSVTKAFTATVVLQLVGEDRLAVDDTVERWLPGVVRGNGNDGRRMTVRNLLQHTSGLHDDIPPLSRSAEDFHRHRYDTHPPEEMVTRALRHRPDFEPGKGWKYGNTGYILLGMIIERVTGDSWYSQMQKRILRPLGLRHTTWPGASPTVPGPHAEGYQRFTPGTLVNVTEHRQAYTAGAAGGLISTTADVGAFFRALLGGRLLRPALLARMKRTVPVKGDLLRFWPGARNGLGLFSRPLSCGGRFWSHGGDILGYKDRNAFTSDGRYGVVLSMSTQLAESPDSRLEQEHAATQLIDNALCRAKRTT
ncbi:MAG TPA: serine hydrolase domain-containing protein [Thermomonospora sp.]|nr:serine hydrolase domain-containing protein [Thermomonospora sp.]